MPTPQPYSQSQGRLRQAVVLKLSEAGKQAEPFEPGTDSLSSDELLRFLIPRAQYILNLPINERAQALYDFEERYNLDEETGQKLYEFLRYQETYQGPRATPLQIAEEIGLIAPEKPPAWQEAAALGPEYLREWQPGEDIEKVIADVQAAQEVEGRRSVEEALFLDRLRRQREEMIMAKIPERDIRAFEDEAVRQFYGGEALELPPLGRSREEFEARMAAEALDLRVRGYSEPEIEAALNEARRLFEEQQRQPGLPPAAPVAPGLFGFAPEIERWLGPQRIQRMAELAAPPFPGAQTFLGLPPPPAVPARPWHEPLRQGWQRLLEDLRSPAPPAPVPPPEAAISPPRTIPAPGVPTVAGVTRGAPLPLLSADLLRRILAGRQARPTFTLTGPRRS